MHGRVRDNYVPCESSQRKSDRNGEKNHYRNNFVKKQKLIETERAFQVHKPLVFAPITASVIK